MCAGDFNEMCKTRTSHMIQTGFREDKNTYLCSVCAFTVMSMEKKLKNINSHLVAFELLANSFDCRPPEEF